MDKNHNNLSAFKILNTLFNENTSLEKHIKIAKQDGKNIEELVRLIYANKLIDDVERQIELHKNQSIINEVKNENKELKQEIVALKEAIENITQNISRNNSIEDNSEFDEDDDDETDIDVQNYSTKTSSIISEQRNFEKYNYLKNNPRYANVYEYRGYMFYLDKNSIEISPSGIDTWQVTFRLERVLPYSLKAHIFRTIDIQETIDGYQIIYKGTIIENNPMSLYNYKGTIIENNPMSLYKLEYNVGLYIADNFDL